MNEQSVKIALPSAAQPIPVKLVTFQSLMEAAARTGVAAQPLYYYPDVTERDTPPQAYHHADFFSLYLISHGRGVHVIEGVPYGVARGDVYVMGAGMTHYFAECDPMVADTLHFTSEIFDSRTLAVLADTLGFHSFFMDEPLRRGWSSAGRWLHLTPEACASATQSIQEIRQELESGTAEGAMIAHGLFFRLLVHLARHYAQSRRETASAPMSSGAHKATVAAAVSYLEDHFGEPVRVTDLAARAFLSPDRFSEVFSAVMGRTPRDYLSHLRLERAKTLLTDSDQTITDIALATGFGDASHFTRVFRAATNMTPTAYRRRHSS